MIEVDGYYVLVCETFSFGAGGRDICIVKLDSSGNVLLMKTVGGTSHERGFSVIRSSDGGYVIGGLTFSFGAGGSDFYILKLGPSFDTCLSEGILDYTVSSGGDESFGGSITSPSSLTSVVYPTEGTGGLVDNVCYFVSGGGTGFCQLPPTPP